MSRLKAGEGWAERRARRRKSRRRQRRKMRRGSLAGAGVVRMGQTLQMLRAGELPLPGLKARKKADFERADAG